MAEKRQRVEHFEHQKTHPVTSAKGDATGVRVGFQGVKFPGSVLAPLFLSFWSLFVLLDCQKKKSESTRVEKPQRPEHFGQQKTHPETSPRGEATGVRSGSQDVNASGPISVRRVSYSF